jgi:hypothetical protein
MPQRRFPPPWSIEELDAAFVVKDANGRSWRGASKRSIFTAPCATKINFREVLFR